MPRGLRNTCLVSLRTRIARSLLQGQTAGPTDRPERVQHDNKEAGENSRYVSVALSGIRDVSLAASGHRANGTKLPQSIIP
jgi:hypothetical protein